MSAGFFGYPKINGPFTSTTFTVTAENSGGATGNSVFNEFEERGLIVPAHKNIDVMADNTHKAKGEIAYISAQMNNEYLFVYLEGVYASLASIPFTSLVLNGFTFTKASASWGIIYTGDSDKTRLDWTTGAGKTPIGVGGPVSCIIVP